MDKKHQEKIDLLIKYLKREPKEVDLAPKRKGKLSFVSKDIYKKYCMLDKHIKLVAKAINEGYITSDYFFKSVKQIKVKNYYGNSELFALFSNSAKMLLFSTFKYKEVGRRFFHKFVFENPFGHEVDIDMDKINRSPRDRSNFDLVEN